MGLGLSDWYWSSSQNNTNNAYNTNFNNGYMNNNNVNNNNSARLSASFIILKMLPSFKKVFFRSKMEKILKFEDLYEAYILCLKNKKRKKGTYNFVNIDLCTNLYEILNELNNKQYEPKPSNCYVITDPALREIYAAQFKDRVIQHFYLKEIEDILESKFVKGCSSCRKGKGTDYALNLLKTYLVNTSNNGKDDCYYLKIDLSGYFMSIDRKQVSLKFKNLIKNDYKGKHKQLLLYLTPIIFEINPALNCKYKCSEKLRNLVPERRKMKPYSQYGMAIGNLTAQAASNLNLNDFDNFVVNDLKFNQYVRYVDDAIIICKNKEKLKNAINKIKNKLNETHQILNEKKTKIDTAYHGVKFLGKISYPYGYQKTDKIVNKRLVFKAKTIKFKSNSNLLAKVNAQIGTLKNYNCRKVIFNYNQNLQINAKKLLMFDKDELKFILNINK